MLPGRAQRPVEYRRSGEVPLDRQRGGAAGTALFGRHGAIGHLQLLADRARGGDLPRGAVAYRAADQPTGAAHRGVIRSVSLPGRGHRSAEMS